MGEGVSQTQAQRNLKDRGTNQPGFSTVAGVHVIYWILYIVYCLHLFIADMEKFVPDPTFQFILAPVPSQNLGLLFGQVKC